MDGTHKPLRPGELAQLTGVSSDTIRHYERIGILPAAPRTSSGYRMYPPDAIERVRLVQRALQLGFTLSELSDILRVRDTGQVPCHRVLNLTKEKLQALDQRILELRRAQRYMRELVHQWQEQLSHTAPGQRAMLLASLADKPTMRAKSSENLKRRKQT